eukprot:178726_1
MGNKQTRSNANRSSYTTTYNATYTANVNNTSSPRTHSNVNQSSEYKIQTKVINKTIDTTQEAKAFKSEYDAVLKIEYTIHGFTRLNYEQIHNKYIPIGIKSIIIKYCGYFFIDSSILNGNEKIILADHILKNKINDGENDGIHLLFRATRDGFSEKKFHELCDNKGATVVIIKNNTGSTYGGFTTKHWKSDKHRHDVRDDKSFVFRIINDRQVQQKRCIGILNYAYYGPAFGINTSNLDIFLCGDCNTNPASHANGINIRNCIIKDFEVFCLKSEYIEMYKQYTEKLNALIEQRKQEIENKKKEYKSFPLPDGINEHDLFSLSDDENESDINNSDKELDFILKQREKEIRDSMQ